MRLVRYSILSVIFLAAFGASAFAQTFDLQSPFPNTTSLYGVSSSGSTVYSVGDRATFMKSTDGGTNWTRLLPPYTGTSNPAFLTTDRFNCTVFSDQSTGVIFGNAANGAARVFRTVDGGSSVTLSTSGMASNVDIRSAWFTSSSRGYAVGRNTTVGKVGVVYTTLDGGATWTSVVNGISPGSTNYTFSGVHFQTDSIGWVVGTDSTNPAATIGLVYYTANAGANWTRKTSVNFPAKVEFRNVYFLSALRGYIVGRDGNATGNSILLQTFDGGLTWTRDANCNVAGGNFYDIKFLKGDTTIGWVVGDETVGTTHWQTIFGMSYNSQTQTWGWVRQVNPLAPYILAGTLYAVRPASTLAAWAVGYSGDQTSLVMTYAGSANWYKQSRSNGVGVLNNISFLTRTVGYAAGTPYNNGIPQLMTTQNAGYSWSLLPLLDANGATLLSAGMKLASVQFLNSNTGWICGTTAGGTGYMYKTTDGAGTWNPAVIAGTSTPIAATSSFLAMKWQDVVSGFFVGNAGAAPYCYYTTDAGTTWNRSILATGTFGTYGSGSLNCVTTRPGYVFVGGTTNSGSTTPILLRSLDQASTWLTMNVTTAANGNIKGIYSQSLDSIWVCGQDNSGGFIRYSKNASALTPTWSAPNALPSSTLGGAASINGVYFVTNLIGFAVGSRNDGNALVLSSVDGGVNWTEANAQLSASLNAVTVAFTNQADLWAAGTNEAILHSVISMPLVTWFPTQMFQNTTRAIGDTAWASFEVGNTGTSNLTLNLGAQSWSDNAIKADYTMDPKLAGSGTYTIVPGRLDTFFVKFAPSVLAGRIVTFTVPTNSVKGDAVKVTMNGVGGQSMVTFIPDNTGSTTPLSMHNDTVLVGGQYRDAQMVLFNNNSTARLNIKKIELSGVNASDYSIIRTITAPILPGGKDTIIVRFTPSGGYNRLARIVVNTDATNSPNNIILLSGFGGCTEDAFSVRDTLFSTTHLTILTSDSMAFDTVVVCNTCALPVIVNTQTIGGIDQFDYTIVDSLATTIPAGGCDTAIIAFYPLSGAATPKDAQFVVKTNARLSSNLVKQLSGYACSMLQTVTPAAFGDSVPFGGSITHSTTIRNVGACDLIINTLNFAPDSSYTINYMPNVPDTIHAGGLDSINVTFSWRDSEGVKPWQILIHSNASNLPASNKIIYNDYALGGNGVRDLGVVVSSYSLQQNYPNPFNPTTLIRYAVPSRQHVTLRVFNALGQTVATLADEMTDAGQYHVSFDATNLPSGTYVYELRAGTEVIARTMTLLK